MNVTDVRWVLNEQTGYHELVRQSDGFVLDRRPAAAKRSDNQVVTRQASPENQSSQEKGRNEMKEKARQRAEQLIGKKFGLLTIREIAGQHPGSGAVIVKAECDCGEWIEVLASDITTGRREICNKIRCRLSPRNAEVPAEETTTPASGDGEERVFVNRQPRGRRAKSAVKRTPRKTKSTGARRSTSKAIERRARANGHEPIQVAPPHDLASISSVIEAIATIAEKVSIEDAEALAVELRRMESQPPIFQLRGANYQAAMLPSYRRLAEAFVEFRRGIQE